MSSLPTTDWYRFAEKVELAIETSREESFEGGTSGLEVEFNILDQDFNPVVRVGTGPERRSFADYLYEERLPEWVRKRFQLEVFHWMTEIATKPYYDGVNTAIEARLLEGVLLNTLFELGLTSGDEFVATHGSIATRLQVSGDSIPDGWNLARQRYLRLCVDLFGDRLATAGIHTNHSLPEALLSWDFLHLPLSERRGRTLEDYRNDAVIRATRLLRPMCPAFIAISAASPLAWEEVNGQAETVLTEIDSNRLLAFPNPGELDVAGLYASHRSYLDISYDLVRTGTRFGANNWTPVRARSGVDPVNRNILATSGHLKNLYRRGIYSLGEHASLEEAEHALIVENLCARVDLPMNRVEVRTDEGGDSLPLSIAKIVFKDLLMLRIYGDPQFGGHYRYDREDIERARRNETAAARDGLDARIENPLQGGECTVREMLGYLLDEVDPLAEAFGRRKLLEPLIAMRRGEPNPASELRLQLKSAIGTGQRSSTGQLVIPPEAIRELWSERRKLLADEVATLVETPTLGGQENAKLQPLITGLRKMSNDNHSLPIQATTTPVLEPVRGVSDRVFSVLELACELVRIPSVTNCPEERISEVLRCAKYIASTVREGGLEVRLFEDGRYPSLMIGFPGQMSAPVTLSGHFDVVKPEPDDCQFEPRIDGDYLWGRGAADMKTVVASNIQWMLDRVRSGGPYPGINLMLIGNEENGESDAWGTPHVLAQLEQESGWVPQFMLMGERTGENGDELYGEVCTENRGVLRLRLVAHGKRGHTGTGRGPGDLLDNLIEARNAVGTILNRHLTLSSRDGWESTARFPFLTVGEDRIYNITAGEGALGVEIRPIPGDDENALLEEVRTLCQELGMDYDLEVQEGGIKCPTNNPFLNPLLAAVEEVSREPTRVGRKKPGTSARFAPGGNAVVWGQTGIGPHARDERHFIPSIEPYLKILDAYAEKLEGDPGSTG
ncbi:MAG: M20/M25/M40 family metallo-hydrolase [bacterium]|nr:M20/M25/M40 family metallo-hydrolase [bacterium]